VRKALALLAEGVRDGAAARAAHDHLRTVRSGQVSATLNIISVDLSTGTLVISRNSNCPAVLLHAGEVRLLDAASEPVGIHPKTRPVIEEMAIAPGLGAVVYTDGIEQAGHVSGGSWEVGEFVRERLQSGIDGARELADAILARARELDSGRPKDDMTVVVVWILPRPSHDGARRLEASFPLDSH